MSERKLEELDFQKPSYDEIRKMEYIEGFTNLFSSFGVVNPFQCHCDNFYGDIECYCEKEEEREILVEVRLIGEPVQTHPNESTYNVKVYSNFDYKQKEFFQDDVSEGNAYRFSLIYEFAISDSLDNTSLDYRQMLQFLFLCATTKQMLPSREFYGKKGRDSYISAFYSLAKKLTNPETKSRGDQPEENAHVSTKKKRK